MSKFNGIVEKSESEFIDYIRDNHLDVWEWMKSKARLNHIVLSKVFRVYESEIRKMINDK